MLADVEMAWTLPDEEVQLFFSPEGLVVVAPLPGGRLRVVATLDHAPEDPDPGYVPRCSRARGPGDGTRCTPWPGPPASGCTTGWRRPTAGGRSSSAGDAAHTPVPRVDRA